MNNSRDKLLKLAADAALCAGSAIVEVYNSEDFSIELKADHTPLTRADKAAHNIITGCLKLSGFPVLSEESKDLSWKTRKDWKKFWLVDPLDGTREFINRNGEFTVNIAFIEEGEPTIGIIYIPVSRTLYFADIHQGAYKLEDVPADLEFLPEFAKTTAIKLPSVSRSDYGIVASRSHLNAETAAFIAGLERRRKDVRIISKGSSLKMCMIAEGEADIYPRFGPTSEWDTAAGHAIIVASGGKVVKADSEEPLQYNKDNLLNPWFIAYRNTNNKT